MIKFKTTKKRVQEGYFCFSVGYCELQTLLRYENAVAYTCGLYGWNADIFTFGNIAIVTGYRPFGTDCDHNMLRKYETKARAITDGTDDYKQKEKKIKRLLAKFLKELKE